LLQEVSEALLLLFGLPTNKMPQTGLCEGGNAIVVIGHAEGFSAGLLRQVEEVEVGRNGGSGGAAEPGEFRLGIDFAGVEEGFVMQSLPQRIAVTDDVHATRTALTTDLDVRGPPPNPLKDLELIPDAYWFSESGLWATNCGDSPNL